MGMGAYHTTKLCCLVVIATYACVCLIKSAQLASLPCGSRACLICKSDPAAAQHAATWEPLLDDTDQLIPVEYPPSAIPIPLYLLPAAAGPALPMDMTPHVDGDMTAADSSAAAAAASSITSLDRLDEEMSYYDYYANLAAAADGSSAAESAEFVYPGMSAAPGSAATAATAGVPDTTGMAVAEWLQMDGEQQARHMDEQAQRLTEPIAMKSNGHRIGEGALAMTAADTSAAAPAEAAYDAAAAYAVAAAQDRAAIHEAAAAAAYTALMAATDETAALGSSYAASGSAAAAAPAASASATALMYASSAARGTAAGADATDSSMVREMLAAAWADALVDVDEVAAAAALMQGEHEIGAAAAAIQEAAAAVTAGQLQAADFTTGVPGDSVLQAAADAYEDAVAADMLGDAEADASSDAAAADAVSAMALAEAQADDAMEAAASEHTFELLPEFVFVSEPESDAAAMHSMDSTSISAASRAGVLDTDATTYGIELDIIASMASSAPGATSPSHVAFLTAFMAFAVVVSACTTVMSLRQAHYCHSCLSMDLAAAAKAASRRCVDDDGSTDNPLTVSLLEYQQMV